MGRKRSPGLRNRAGIWHIEKQILGHKIHESSGTSDLTTAELILARRIEEIRQATVLGVRPRRIFREAAVKFLEENLHLAARLWRDENGLTWLDTPPLIQMLPVTDARRPYPISWDEQRKLFRALPGHLARMALFKVNTGCREQEVCQLRWEWEARGPQLGKIRFQVGVGEGHQHAEARAPARQSRHFSHSPRCQAARISAAKSMSASLPMVARNEAGRP